MSKLIESERPLILFPELTAQIGLNGAIVLQQKALQEKLADRLKQGPAAG